MEHESIVISKSVNKFIGKFLEKLLTVVPYQLFIMLADGKVTDVEIESFMKVVKDILVECLSEGK